MDDKKDNNKEDNKEDNKKDNHHHNVSHLGQTAIRPPEISWKESIRLFFHDRHKGTYLTRTPLSWLQILFYYFCVYLFLVCYFALLFHIFLLTLDTKAPKYMMDSSPIGKTPGLSTRPAQSTEMIEAFQYHLRRNWNGQKSGDNRNETDSDEGFAVRMEQYIESLKNQGKAKQCNETELAFPRSKDSDFCAIDTSRYGPCAEWPYGYAKDDFKPCLIIGFNKIFGLLPEPFTNPSELPPAADKLKPLVEASTGTPRVLINCEGKRDVDNEAFLETKGEIKYYPSHQGIDMGYFPHQDMANTVRPGIAIQLLNLPRGITIRFMCKIWYKGIEHNPKSDKGQIKFDVAVD